LHPLRPEFGPAQSIADLSSRGAAASGVGGHRPNPVISSIKRGETLACRYLRRNGYKVLFRNFAVAAEVRSMLSSTMTPVFVEVKTRGREDFGRPVEAVDREKRKRISRGALAWLRMLDNPDILFRFDVVEVVIADGAKPRVELIKNAFPLSKPYLY
jgi:putative endonuclease